MPYSSLLFDEPFSALCRSLVNSLTDYSQTFCSLACVKTHWKRGPTHNNCSSILFTANGCTFAELGNIYLNSTYYLVFGDAHANVQAILAQYKTEPDSDAQLKLLLPHIASSFGIEKTVSEIIEELKKLELNTDGQVSEWAHDALQGLGKGAPFSLYLTKKHFSEVASAHRNDENHLSKLHGVMKTEYRIALRSSLRHDFTEGVRAVLVDKDQEVAGNLQTELQQYENFLWTAARLTVARRLVAGGKLGGLGFMGSWQLEERNWREKGIWS
ncbi:3-hydroxyisobutyryl-CoA hydrolase-like protein 3, mitochondrial [Dendrobium catenatum]|uniref:3-hydroxyisobutyryl-CoA hydrolase n=1 Tax=Dendrobium catenatum TaxID=906689 RepID=A0A2I0WCT0_9ASPA|nr:3-hydroxyisobutyryl-CoA hydrolase-like protein 3, mitochondrial [Dendrobium catenatum]